MIEWPLVFSITLGWFFGTILVRLFDFLVGAVSGRRSPNAPGV